jgi:hypothetical protein
MEQPPPFDNEYDLAAIADQLSALAEGLRSGGSETSDSSEPRALRSTSIGAADCQTALNNPIARQASYLQLAKSTYADRRRREGILGKPALLGEPAWDILLDLYIAQAEGYDVSVSSACIGSAAPATTGLRWLGVLQDEGLVQRINDPEDQRRVLVRLSPAAIEAMERYFSEVAGLEPAQRGNVATPANGLHAPSNSASANAIPSNSVG